MHTQHRRREELQKRIRAAHGGLGFDIQLISDIAAYYREERTAGRSTREVAEELSVTTWQLVDWHQRTSGPGEQWTEPADTHQTTHKVVLEIPMDAEFWRMLVGDFVERLLECPRCRGEQEERRSVGGLTNQSSREEESE